MGGAKYAVPAALLWSAVMFALGAHAGPLFPSLLKGASGDSELRSHGQFTNPLLECDVDGSISSRKEDFTPELTALIGARERQPGIADLSVYYRDLNNGPVIGVNQNNPFAPASLLKVPIMMTYLNHDEDHPGFLDTKVRYEHTEHLLPENQLVPPSAKIELGKEYTYRQLVDSMIRYSDNEAMALLYDHIPVEDQIDLYKLLGVDPAIVTDATSQLTVRQYSIFFRILFNASYLSRKNSEYALKLLSETAFDDGLRAGVPAAVPIAHKFGERQNGDGVQQFHDCGVVYYPGHPYLLCVMTRGSATPPLLGAIADVSAFVYDKIDAQYGK